MKILHFNLCSDFYCDLSSFKNPNSLSTAEILDQVISKRMITPVTFSQSMKLLGWDAQDFLLNDFFLKKWAKENHLEYVNFEKTIEQVIDKIKPDIIYIQRIMYLFDSEFIKYLKNKFKFIKAVVGTFGHGIVGDAYKQLSVYDLILPITDKFADLSRPHCPQSYCVRTGFDFLPEERPTFGPKKYLFSFMGTSGHGCTDHRNRFKALKYLLKKTPIKIWANEPFAFSKKKYHKTSYYKGLFRKKESVLQSMIESGQYLEINDYLMKLCELKKIHQKLPGSFFDPLQLKKPLQYINHRRVFPAVLAEEYCKKIQESHIVFNIHSDWQGHGGNYRALETAGMGSCLLTDRGEWMSDLFKPHEEMVPYSSIEEAVDLFKDLRKNLKRTQQIALNAQNKVFNQHLVYHRCKEIQEHIANYAG